MTDKEFKVWYRKDRGYKFKGKIIHSIDELIKDIEEQSQRCLTMSLPLSLRKEDKHAGKQ